MQSHDVSDYIHQNVPHPPFIIQDILPVGGSLLLSGAPGVMKSWVSQFCGYCVATGTIFLGMRTTQVRSMLVNFEISPAGYHERLCQMSTRFTVEPRMLWEYSPGTLYIEEEENFHILQEEVNAVDPGLLIIDCVSGCFGGDENNSQQMSGLIRRFSTLKGNNRSLIIVHHSNKNPLAVSPMDRVRGHTKLPGWVDSVLYMVDQPTCKQIQFGKHRLATHPMRSLNVRFQDYVWVLV